MKAFRPCFRKFDIFGSPFSFKYKGEGKYKTSVGGFLFAGYILVVIVIGTYYFIPFFNRKNFSIVYYSMNLLNTENILLKDSKSALAIGLDCDVDKRGGTKAEDLLEINFKFCTFKKDKEGKRSKTTTILNTHSCNYSDFYNIYNDSFDMLNIGKFQCLDRVDDIIQGIFTDEVFTYYDFSVQAKEDSVSHFNNIDRYLIENECKFSIYYSDITIDIDNYKEPINPFLNTIFIQLNPTLISKANMYFMNQYFEDDDYFFSIVNENDSVKKTLFSRVEDYFVYKGLNRSEKKPEDYKFYAKFYIRADTKKTIIKRRYQKIMEFYADSSSLLIALLEVLFIISSFINNFYGDLSLCQQLFLFKDVEDNHLNINKRKQIKQLIDLTEPISPKLLENDVILHEPKYKKGRTINKKEINRNNIKPRMFKKNEIKGREYMEKEMPLNNISLGESIRENVYCKIKQSKVKNEGNIKKINYMNYERKTDKNIRINNKEGSSISNRAWLKKDNTIFNKQINNHKIENFDYSYNILEVIIGTFFCCCMSNKLKKKNIINEKSNNILYNKLDIVLFLRNTILLDIMNETLINDNNNRINIIKFLSRPIISIKKKEENKLQK